jgi:hypothetical protein
MIKNGETLSKPGVRRKPVMSALPPGITMPDIMAEMEDLLRKDADVDVEKTRQSLPWPTGLNR